jgi:hypothetical protein
MCKNDLDEIFNEYYERKKIEEEVSETKKLEEQEKIELIIDKLKEIVIPVIETISKEIEVKGYETSVSKRLKNYAYPGVELSFLPIPKQEENSTHLSNSSISFVSSKSGDLTIRENIYSSKRDRPDSSGFGVNIDNLTKNYVKTEVIKFIKKVLESN